MSKGKLGKLLLLNSIIIILDLSVFSGGVFQTLFGDNTVRTVAAAVVAVVSVIAFFWGNISILFGKKTTNTLYQGDELGSKKDYIKALEGQRNKKVFLKEINKSVEQLNRIRSKNNSLNTLLSQYFSPQEMTSVRFRTVIDSVNEIFYDNIKKMLNRMIIFDEKEYTMLVYKLKYPKPENSPQEIQAWKDRLNIYLEHINYIKSLVDMNEAVLVKLDSLLLELSKLDEFNEKNIEALSAIQEMNDLISQTKFYKQ